MIVDIINRINHMEDSEILGLLRNAAAKPELSIEDRVILYYGNLKMNYLDYALYHAEFLQNYIFQRAGVSDEFLAKHPEITISYDWFQLIPDGCGGYTVIDPKSRVISTQYIRRQAPRVFPEAAGLVL